MSVIDRPRARAQLPGVACTGCAHGRIGHVSAEIVYESRSTWYNWTMDGSEKPNKWKTPAWMKSGTRVVIARGRKYPVGLTGAIRKIEKTGHGVEAWVDLDDKSSDHTAYISVLNLDPV